MAKLFLLDGNSILYRAFFAVPEEMVNKEGESTNAVHGFCSMLATLLRSHTPDGMAVCFDRPEPTFRHQQKPSYKAQRSRAPDSLISQRRVINELLTALKIPVVDMAGFEADDLLATLAVHAADNKDEVVIVSGDRDTFQLPCDPYIKVLYTLSGVSKYVILDEAAVFDRVGVSPSLYPQYAALRGDASDNLPGAPGIGTKRAAQLLAEYGDLDGIFASVDSLTPKLRESLIKSEELVRENLELMTLRNDVPLSLNIVNMAKLQWKQADTAALTSIFAKLDFQNMYWRLLKTVKDTPAEKLFSESDPPANSPLSLF